MAASSALRFIAGIMGIFTCTIMSLLTAPKFLQIHRTQSVQGFNSFPTFFSMVTGAMWIVYGSVIQDTTLMIISNAIGVSVKLVYIIVFLFYADANTRLHFGTAAASIIMLYMVAVARVCDPVSFHEDSYHFAGSISLATCAIMFIIELVYIYKRTAATEFSTRESIVKLLNWTMWLTFSLLQHLNLYSAVGNGLGLVTVLIEIGICKYRY